MAPNINNQFGIPRDVFKNILRVATLEARDPKTGASPGTVASMINRYHSPSYGSNVNKWLIPGQYAVMEKPDFSRTDPSRAVSYYSSPAGQQELLKTGQALRGATDFRSTSYLKDTGNLFKYQDNLIPAMIGGVRKYLTPKELQSTGAKPDYSENTFFNETKRPAPSKWWEKYSDQSAAPNVAPPIQTAIGTTPSDVQSKVLAGNLFGGMTMENLMKQGIQEELLTSLIQPEEDKTNLFAQLLNQTRPYYS